MLVILNRGVAVLLEEMDNNHDDENVWLSEINAEGSEELFPP